MTHAVFQPVAGCAGTSDAKAQSIHRRWLVVDAADNWLAQDACASLGQVQADVRFGYLVLKAPGMLRLDIPIDVLEDDDSVRRRVVVNEQSADVVDEGDLAAAWFSKFLAQPCRLVKLHPDAPELAWP